LVVQLQHSEQYISLLLLLPVSSVGTSSESEEEIVFQRKNRRNNVLRSPDVSLKRAETTEAKDERIIVRTKLLSAMTLLSVCTGWE